MKRLLAALSASALLALVPLSASAITFGEVDTNDRYPFDRRRPGAQRRSAAKRLLHVTEVSEI